MTDEKLRLRLVNKQPLRLQNKSVDIYQIIGDIPLIYIFGALIPEPWKWREPENKNVNSLILTEDEVREFMKKYGKLLKKYPIEESQYNGTIFATGYDSSREVLGSYAI